MRKVNHKRYWAGELMSEPLKGTSARTKAGGIGTIPKLAGNIRQPEAKNQLKFQRNIDDITKWR